MYSQAYYEPDTYNRENSVGTTLNRLQTIGQLYSNLLPKND